MKKEKIQVEYIFDKASKNILWNFLSTASGLSEWFADEVNIKENICCFTWNKSPMEAEILSITPGSKIRFRWIEDEDTSSYFEFKIHTDEMTGAIALLITDYVEPYEKEELISLWDSQIKELKRGLGI